MKQQNWLNFILGMVLILPIFGHARAEGINGLWMSNDDAGKPRAIISLKTMDSVLVGVVEKVYPRPGDLGICSKCPGNFKNKKTQGLQIVWGLKENGPDNWSGGYILDPKNGKIYRAKMTLKDNKLYVRGYIGVSLLGRTQVWERV